MCVRIHEGGGEPLDPTAPAILDLTRTMYVATYWSIWTTLRPVVDAPEIRRQGLPGLSHWEEDLFDLVNPKSGLALPS